MQKYIQTNGKYVNEKNTSSSTEKAYSDEDCEVIHLGIVCSGSNNILLLHTLLKSIYYHRINPLHLHIITNKASKKILNNLFVTWNVPQVRFSLYDMNDYIYMVRWIPNSHYSGTYGLLKLIIPAIIPTHITTKIIILDTDLVVVDDIYSLWKLFKRFNNMQAIGLVDNQSDYYLGKNTNSEPWPAVKRGFNSGVLLYDLEKLKQIKWSKVWLAIAKKCLSVYGATRLGDQDIINAVVKERPELLYEVPCYWNIQLGDHTLSSSCYEHHKIRIVHWNSPKKLNVANKNQDYFKNLYTTFSEYNGNLLRRQLHFCDIVPNISNREDDDMCFQFHNLPSRQLRTILYFREYKYIPSTNDVSLVAQLSFDRIQIIEDLVKNWQGPIVLIFYLTDPELEKCIKFVENSEIVRDRINIAYHAVFKEGEHYPINILRNVGLNDADTPYVFLIDVDFVPMKHLYSILKYHISSMQNLNKKALIIPAFEIQKYSSAIPRNKMQLLRLWDEKIVIPFLSDIWIPGHAPTDYRRWQSALKPYSVKWQPDFEPYIVVKRDVVRYDERFVGFGWNKVSHIMELEAKGYEFIVLPEAFIIHKPHSRSYDFSSYRTSSIYRLCLQILKEEFIHKLNLQYGCSFQYTNTSISFPAKRRKRNYFSLSNTTEENNTDYPLNV